MLLAVRTIDKHILRRAAETDEVSCRLCLAVLVDGIAVMLVNSTIEAHREILNEADWHRMRAAVHDSLDNYMARLLADPDVANLLPNELGEEFGRRAQMRLSTRLDKARAVFCDGHRIPRRSQRLLARDR